MATIAFDLDGTLIDSVHHIHAGVSAALAEMGLPGQTVETTKGFVGKGLPNLLTRTLEHLGQDPALHPELSRRTMHHYVSMPSDPASVYPGVVDALSVLAASHRLTICTNKPHDAALVALRDVDLQHFFELVIGGDSLPTRKPAPEMLYAALDGASEVLYVGDSETDAETAVNADIRYLLYTEGYRKTPVEALPHLAAFSHFDALPDLVSLHLGLQA
jgi:phosphoglycolate phosphatase